MKRIAVLFLSLALWNQVHGQQDSLPSHPDKLSYPPLTYAPPDPAEFRTVLSNGSVLYLSEDHTAPVVEITALIRGGSYLDPRDKIGLAAAAGAVWRSGGTSKRAPEQLDERLDYLAAAISTSFDLTTGEASLFVMSKDADEGLDLFFDVLMNPAFREDKLKLYKEQALEAMKGRNDRADDIRVREFRQLLYGDHPSTWMPARAAVEAITRDDLESFHRRWVHPKNILWVVSGDFKKDEMVQKLERALSGWKASGEVPPRIPAPAQTPSPGVYLIHKEKATQGNVSIGHLGLDIHHPDVYAISLMNYILGGGSFSSRLTKIVRSDEGLAYAVWSSYLHGAWYPGTFTITYQSKNASASYAASLCLQEVRRLIDEGVTAEELESAKNFVIESFPQRFSSRLATLTAFATDEIIGRPKDFTRKYRERIQSVTLKDIHRVAKEHLHPDKMVTVVVGDLDAIRKGDGAHKVSFEDFGPNKVLPLPDPFTLQRPPQK